MILFVVKPVICSYWLQTMSSSSFTMAKKPEKIETEEVPDELLREDLVKQREAILIRRLSQKSVRDKQLKARPKSAKLAQSVGGTKPPPIMIGERKERPKSTGTLEPLTPEALSREEKRKSLMEKKKKLLMLQKIKAAKLAKANSSKPQED